MWKVLTRFRSSIFPVTSFRSLSTLSTELNSSLDEFVTQNTPDKRSSSLASIGGMISEMGNKERYF